MPTTKIDSKYNIGDTVWFMHENKAQEGTVKYIRVDILSNGECKERYTIYGLGGAPIAYQCSVEHFFPTKKALLESL